MLCSMPELIDTHCHLDAAEFDGTQGAVVGRARAAGVAQIVVPAVAADNFDAVLALRSRYGCPVALGLHPIYLNQHTAAHLALLDNLLEAERPVAVGEIGLDFWQEGLDPAQQEALLAAQLKLARRHDLPVLLHVRRAQDRVLKYLRQYPVPGGIAHAFNGSVQQAEAFIALGFCLGFGGAMSYSGSTRIRQLAATLPLDALVLETDAPDMRPEWAQGVPNEPANVAHYATLLASLRGVPLDTIAEITSQNAKRVLRLSAAAPVDLGKPV
ncbi:TatD family deoxyribonuclease [Crenobacter intestini]|uniref:TatD family deoxyribonuclease n=2 Tax=Crenobacter intestini TaxID=2563443 RepID=A0A4T0UXC1_9NEIS|nr:TatD family deoxyribonuclease [Crenobacter intestini]